MFIPIKGNAGTPFLLFEA